MTLSNKKQPKPFGAVFLIFLIIFQSVSALFGGIVLILGPQGNLLKMPVSSLEYSPFHNFLIPGLILFIVLGLFPAFAAFCLIFHPGKKWVNSLNIYHDRHCGWTYSLYTGLMLMIWITMQIALIGYGDFIHTLYALIGILITVITLVPNVMNYYHKEDEPETGIWRTL